MKGTLILKGAFYDQETGQSFQDTIMSQVLLSRQISNTKGSKDRFSLTGMQDGLFFLNFFLGGGMKCKNGGNF